MCVIVDADVASGVFSEPPRTGYDPLVRWLFKGSGWLVSGGENLRELKEIGSARRAWVKLSQAGKTKRCGDEEVDSEQGKVQSMTQLTSDDAHVIALARVSGARTLCSGDHELHQDFKNIQLVPKPQGKVYQDSSHERVLVHTPGCPAWRKVRRRRRRRK